MATLTSQGSQRGRVEKKPTEVACGSFAGLLGTKSFLNPKKVVVGTTLKHIVRKVLHKRSLRIPPTMKMMVSYIQNHPYIQNDQK